MINQQFMYCYIKWNIVIKINQRICAIMIISLRFLLLISFKWSTKYYLKLLRNEIIISLFEKSEKFVYPKIQIPPLLSRIKKIGFLDKEVFSEFDWLIFFFIQTFTHTFTQTFNQILESSSYPYDGNPSSFDQIPV